MKFVPLNCKTHYDVRNAICRPKQTVAAVKKLGYDNFAICDPLIISGSLKFREKSQCIIGTEVCTDNNDNISIFAKNREGWTELAYITSIVNEGGDKCVDKTKLVDILSNAKNLIVVYNYLENNPLPNSYYGINMYNSNHMEIRGVAKAKKIPAVCMHEIKFPEKDDADDFGLLLSIADNITLAAVKDKYAHYFKDIYYIPTLDELVDIGYTDDEINNTHELATQCADYKLEQNPILPKFTDHADKLLRDKCMANIKTPEELVRFNEEIAIIEKYKLSDYFLIIGDIIDYCNKKFGISGIRGSAGGSLVSYLLGISKTHPLKYGLLFERFLNAGRFTSDRVQLPDIDIDVPAEAREDIIKYIKNKYKHENVGQILTYQRIKTAAAIKAVFKSRSNLSFKEVNDITKGIPEEAKISDKLKLMDEPSVLMYALEHDVEYFRQWAYLDENGDIQGAHADLFKQVLRLEGLNSARSKHAAGIIVADQPLNSFCPMIWDATDKKLICGMEMNDLEAIGCLKIDVLGLRLFDKILGIKKRVEHDLHRS